MTGRTTIHPIAGLWTGLTALLLFSASVHSESALNESSIKVASKIDGSRRIEPEVRSTLTLKGVNETSKSIGPEAIENIVGNDTVMTEGHVPQGETVVRNEKLKVPEAPLKVNKVEDKRANGEFLTEFDRENYGETDEVDEENDSRESTTPPTKKPISKNPSSSEKDHKDIGKKTPENNFSLINDTNVNYIWKKVAKGPKDEDVYDKGVKDNSTNIIATGDDGQLEKTKGPKSQVEVIRNSTLPKILRLSEETNGTKSQETAAEASGVNNLPIDANVTSRIVDDEDNDNKTLRARAALQSWWFGSTNTLITDSNKTNPLDDYRRIITNNSDVIETTNDKKSSELKPYPYVKVTKTGDATNDTNPEISLATDSINPETTQEASALDNTIGQRQEGEKIVVTEASVVIDNSIQQFKPTHPKRSGNTSRTLTSLGSTSSTVTSSLEDNEMVVTTTSTESLTSNNGTTIFNGNFPVSNRENDVPRDGEVTTSLETKGTSLDITGNGITEVTQSGTKNVSNLIVDVIEQTTIRATESELSVQNTTERMVTSSENPAITTEDIRTEMEDSMLKISTLNVTEVTAMTPLTEAQTLRTTSPGTTTSMTTEAATSPSSITEERATTIDPQSSVDVSSEETPGVVETFTLDSSMDTTTSNVEYEFVGLTESTITHKQEATTRSSNASIVNKEDYSTSTSVSDWDSSSSISIALTTRVTPLETEAATEILEDQETSTYPGITITEIGTSEDVTTVLSTLDSRESDESGSSSEDSEESTSVEDSSSTETNDTTDMTTVNIPEDLTKSTRPDDTLSDLANTTESGRSAERSSTTSIPEISTNSNNSNATLVLETQSMDSSIIEDTSELTIVSKSPVDDSTSSISSTESTTFYEPESPTETSSTIQNSINVATSNATKPGNRAVPQDELTSLVRIIFEGNWADVCPHLPALRQSLADLLTSGLDKTVLAGQIIFQKNPCMESYASSTVTTEMPLTTLLLYVVDKEGNFDAEMTKLLPSLYSRSPIKLQIHSFQLVQDADSGNAIAVVVVSCVALICLVLLAGLLFIMRKRQTRFNYGERCRPVSLDAYSLDSVSAYNSVRGRKGAVRASKRSYGNPTFEDSSAIPSHPLNFAGLSAFCNEQNTIAEEFIGIPQVTARIDELPQGSEVKNRYANVVPLPETRVSLMKINNDPLTEYINASYVRGPKNATKYYIACQAPIESTVTDFWRMIWEQQSKVVIMLTDLVENGVEKCAEYIPPSEVTDCHRLYGDYQVTLKKRETKEKYAISTLHLKNLENNTFREISHIWYLWPANGVQSDAAGLIAVLLEARALQRGGPGPVVVHCSPGTGRTGTLIALDLGIRQYEITRTVDVPRVVYTIRRDRAGAVQTKEQYAFIYKALNLYATKLAGGALES